MHCHNCGNTMLTTVSILIMTSLTTQSSAAEPILGDYDYYQLVDDSCTADHVTTAVAQLLTSAAGTSVECLLRCRLNADCGSYHYNPDDESCTQMDVNFLVCDNNPGTWNKVMHLTFGGQICDKRSCVFCFMVTQSIFLSVSWPVQVQPMFQWRNIY